MMNRILLAFCGLFLCLLASAQPDACTTPMVLTNGTLVAGQTTVGMTMDPGVDVVTCTDDVNTVWYQYTLGAGETGFDIVISNTVIPNMSISVWNNVCAPTILYQDYCGLIAVPQTESFTCLLPGTYFIQLGTTLANEGTYDIQLNALTTPFVVNDNCASASTISSPDGSLPAESNSCASLEAGETIGSCVTGHDASVWYTYTVSDTIQDLTISSSLANGSITAFEDGPGCFGTELGCAVGVDLILDCLLEGAIIYISINSAAVDADAFSVSVSEGAASPSNDGCDNPKVITFTNCEPEQINVNTLNACPELSDMNSGCNFGTEATVWYEITIPPGGNGIIIEDVSGTSYVSVFDDSCVPTVIYQGDNGFCTPAGTSNTYLNLTENTTYYIAVGNQVEGSSTFNITVLVPPRGDDPDGVTTTTADDVVDLGIGGGSDNNTTCCAQGFNDDPVVDFAFQAPCNAINDDDAVWYMFNTGVEEGFDISVNFSGGGSGGFQVYEGTAAGPSLGNVLGSSCDAADIVSIANCTDNSIVWIKIGSQEINCGQFSLDVMAVQCGSPYADECMDIDGAVTINPIADGATICLPSCNTYACSEGVDCAGSEASIWFEVQTDASTTSLTVSINGANFTPIVTAATGNNCTDMVTLSSLPLCSPDNPLTFGVGINQSIFINISAVEGTGMLGDFELCISAVSNSFDCYAGSMTVTRPENPSEDPNGPYCIGETVNFCVHIDFTVSFSPPPNGNNGQWIQGIIPVVNNGWDLLVTPLSTQLGPAPSFWIDEGNVGYNFPNPSYSIVTLANGNLGIEYLSGSAGFSTGEPLPGGWWLTSLGGGPLCTSDLSDPDTTWGDPLPFNVSGIQMYDFCFDLTTRTPVDEDDCMDPVLSDLSVDIFVFADGETGCYQDLSCSLSAPLAWNGNLACNYPPDLVFGNTDICSGFSTNVDINTIDNSNTPIFVDPINNPNITGATSHTFPGVGNIDDILVNMTNMTEIQQYEVLAQVSGASCPGPKFIIEVTVYPQLLIMPVDGDACENENDDAMISITATGGSGVYVTYKWSPLTSSTDELTIPQPLAEGTYTYDVIVTDDHGCAGTTSVDLVVHPEVLFDIDPINFEGCSGDPDFIVTVNPTSGSPFYLYNWSVSNSPGLITGIGFGETFSVDLSESITFAGIPEIISVTVTDFYACSAEAQVPILINLEPLVDLQFETIGCGETEQDVTVTGIPQIGGVALTSQIEFWDLDADTLIDVKFTDTWTWTITYEGLFGFFIQDSNGCGGADSIQIDFVEGVQPLVTSVSPICLGSNSDLEVTNMGDFVMIDWGDEGMGSPVSVSPIVDTSYIVTVTDMGGCISTDEILVEVSPLPDIIFSGATSFCLGGNTTIDVGGDPSTWTYTWEDSGGTAVVGVDSSVNISMPDTYTVTVTDENMCTDVDMIVITEDTEITVSISSIDICDNSLGTLDAGPGLDTYQWYDPSGDPLGDQQTQDVTMPGSYTVSVTDQGCNGNGIGVVSQFITPSASVTDTVIVCNADSGIGQTFVDFTMQSSGSTGSWADTDNSMVDMSDLTNVDFNLYAEDTLTFTFTTNTAMAPCIDVLYTMEVVIQNCSCPNPNVNNGPDICNDGGGVGTIVLSSLETNNTDPGTWSYFQGPEIMIDISSGTFDPDGLMGGTYQFIYTLDNPIGGICPPADTISINVVETPAATVQSEVNICNVVSSIGVTVLNLDALILTGAGSGIWMDSDGTGVDLSDPTNVDFLGISLGSYTFNYFVAATPPCDPISPSVLVAVTDCLCPFVGTNLISNLCEDDAAIDLSDAVSSGSESGSWFYSDMTPVAGDIFDPVVEGVGIHLLTFKIDNPMAGCDSTSTEQFEVLTLPFVSLTSEANVCNNTLSTGPTSLDFDGLVIDGLGLGTWMDSDGTGVDLISDLSNVDFIGVLAGTYTFTYLVDAPDPCMGFPLTIDINVGDCLCPFIGTDPIANLCEDDAAIDLSDAVSSGSESGSWFYSDMTPVAGDIFDPVVEGVGIHLLTFKSDNPMVGCDSTSTEQFEVLTLPFVSLTSEANVCNNTLSTGPTSLDFDGLVIDGLGLGTWMDSDGTGVDLISDLSNVDFIGVLAGTYTFTYLVDAPDPCTGFPLTIDINVGDCLCPFIATTPIQDQCTTSVPFSLDAFVDPSSESGSWVFEDGSPVPGNMFDPSGFPAGPVTVIYTLDTPPVDPICPDESPQVIMILEQPNAGTPNDQPEFCADESSLAMLADILSGASAGGSWSEVSAVLSTGGAFDAVSGTFNITGQVPGLYEFEYSFMTVQPCNEVSATVQITIHELPIADAGGDMTLDCTTTSVTIGGTSTTSGAGIEVLWAEAGGAGIADPTTSMTSVTQSGTYILTVTNTHTSCTATDEVVVDIDPSTPSMNLIIVQPSCSGDTNGSIEIEAMGGDPPYSYSIDGVNYVASPVFSDLGAGQFTLYVSDAIDCIISANAEIIDPPVVTVTVTADPSNIEFGGTIDLNFTTSVDEGNIQSFDITEEGISIGNGTFISNMTATPAVGQTEYCVEVTDLNGCIDTDCTTVSAFEKIIKEVYIPNIFNPNGEHNTKFLVFGGSNLKIVNRLLIFDRWGERVFSVENILPNDLSTGWDATFNGELVTQGVYVYIVDVEFEDGEERTIYGDVTVIY